MVVPSEEDDAMCDEPIFDPAAWPTSDDESPETGRRGYGVDAGVLTEVSEREDGTWTLRQVREP